MAVPTMAGIKLGGKILMNNLPVRLEIQPGRPVPHVKI
jgi:hypothetical protein